VPCGGTEQLLAMSTPPGSCLAPSERAYPCAVRGHETHARQERNNLATPTVMFGDVRSIIVDRLQAWPT